MRTVFVKEIEAPIFCEKEALRYAGCRTPDDGALSLLYEVKDEVWDKLCYKVCFCEFDVKQTQNGVVLDDFLFASKDLKKALDGFNKVLIFGATVGIELDRLMQKYSKISPSKAFMLQSIGAERIEALCDAFCSEYESANNLSLGARFSPGYGDFCLNAQKQIFSILDCPRKIGLSLGNSLIMSPSKSVTAFVGVNQTEG